MPWVEQYQSNRQGDMDATAKGATIRQFRVWDIDSTLVLRNPGSVQNSQGQGLPVYNDQHPVHTSMRLDAYGLSPVSQSVFDATAYYSTNRRFRGSAYVDPLVEGFFSFAGGTAIEQWEMPYAQRVTWRLPAVSQIWTPRLQTVMKTTTRAVLRVNVNVFGDAQRKAVELQTGCIHLINAGGTPKPYLYLGAEYQQEDAAPPKWSVEHKWSGDEGTLSAIFPTDATLLFPPFTTLPPPEWGTLAGTYLRPPFHHIILVPHPSGPEFQPTFKVFCPYVTVPNGHLTLPGVS